MSGLFPCIPCVQWFCHWLGTREAPSTQRMAEAVQAIPWGIKRGDFPQIQRGPPIFVLQIQSVGLPESVGEKTIHQKGRSRASSPERACGCSSFPTGHTERPARRASLCDAGGGGITAEKGHSKRISAVIPRAFGGFCGASERRCFIISGPGLPAFAVHRLQRTVCTSTMRSSLTGPSSQ